MPEMTASYTSTAVIDTGTRFHIILEYANEGTLEDFFQNVAPPTNPHDIYVFWRNILQLLCALTTLHNIVGEEDSEGYL